MEHITTGIAGLPGGAYSAAVALDDLVFTAGQTGTDPVTGVVAEGLDEQMRLAVRNLEAVLAESGSSLAGVVKTTCYLTDIRAFPEFDALYRSLFPRPWPARSTVGVALAGSLLFEIDAVAARNQS